jgi:hypothetical protein
MLEVVGCMLLLGLFALLCFACGLIYVFARQMYLETDDMFDKGFKSGKREAVRCIRKYSETHKSFETPEEEQKFYEYLESVENKEGW